MTQDKIIAMAREAGFFAQELHCSPPIIRWSGDEKQLERFAALVAAHEREVCANVCEQGIYKAPANNSGISYNAAKEDCAAAIRARGKA